MDILRYTKAIKVNQFCRSSEKAQDIAYKKADSLIAKYVAKNVDAHISFAGDEFKHFVVYVTHN